MSATHRVRARLASVSPWRGGGQVGVRLGYQPERSRSIVDPIDDFADLGPEYCIAAVAGVGKVLRILKAARIACPHGIEDLLGQERRVARLLERAIDTPLLLGLRARNRVRFSAWTDEGIRSLENVSEVHETLDAYVIHLEKGRFPVRIPREAVVRQKTESEQWYEVVQIEQS
jgi:hypothetical protein